MVGAWVDSPPCIAPRTTSENPALFTDRIKEQHTNVRLTSKIIVEGDTATATLVGVDSR